MFDSSKQTCYTMHLGDAHGLAAKQVQPTEASSSIRTPASSSGRPAKLQKLDNIKRKVPFVTQSALASLIAEFKEHGLPELSSRHHIGEARQLAISGTAYGALITSISLACIDGSSLELGIVNFLTFLAIAFEAGGALYDGLCKAMDEHECCFDSPFQLLLYSDEIVPGNPIGHTLSRKSWVWYCSILELGPMLLQKEQAWQCICICRSQVVNNIQAGVSQINAALLKAIFCHKDYNVATGITLKGPDGQQRRLYLKFCGMIQDGAANKLGWSIKGDAGSRFCILCKNLYAKSSLIMQDGEHLLTSSMHKMQSLKLASNADIKKSIQRLKQKNWNCQSRTSKIGNKHVALYTKRRLCCLMVL